MTKISSKTAYPKKKPISSDYFVGTDSEDFNKTVNFGFEEVAGLVNKLNGTPLLNYLFSTSPYLSTEVLLEGRFLSDENELSTPSLTKLHVNKFNNSGDNLQELYLFLQANATDFYLKLRNSNNQNNAVYFNISSIEDFPDYFILNITVFKENEFLPLLENLNVYFFDFELKATSAGTSDPLKLDKDGYTGTAKEIDDRVIALESLQNLSTNFIGQAYAVWTGEGLIYDVIYPNYYIEGVSYFGATDQITLDAADPTNPRQDVIAVDVTGAIKKTGIASPDPAAPSVDTQTEIYISTIFIGAGATTPTGVSNTDIYKENIEFATSTNLGTVNFNSTTFPFSGTKCIDIGAFTPTKYLRFSGVDSLEISDFSSLQLFLYLKASFATTARLAFRFINGTTPVSSTLSLNNNQFNYNRTVVQVYQNIVIPISAFTFWSGTFTGIEIFTEGNNASGCKIDNISLQTGGAFSSPKQKALTSIITDSGVANATTEDDTFQFKGSSGLGISAIGKIITFTSLFTASLKATYDAAHTWVSTNGANVMTHLSRTDNPHSVTKSQVGLGNVDNISDANKPVSTAQQAALDLKLNTADYNQHFKGVYLTEAALNAAHPTANVGDSAQVNEAGRTGVVNYSWDAEENIWVAGGGTGGAANTDALPEGSSNLYFTTGRALTAAPAETATTIATINHGATVKSVLVDADEVIGQNSTTSFSLIRTVWSDVWTYIKSKADTVYQLALVSGTNIKTINGASILGSGDLTVGGASTVVTTLKNILSTDIVSQDLTAMVTYINNLTPVLSVAANEIVDFKITDTGQIFRLNLRNRSFGVGQSAISTSDVFIIEDINFEKLFPVKFLYQATFSSLLSVGVHAIGIVGTGVFIQPNGRYFYGMSTAATAGSSCYIKEANTTYLITNRGFHYQARIIKPNLSSATTARGFFGLGQHAGYIGNINPSTYAGEFIGFGFDSADTNFFLMYRLGTVVTKTSMGVNFPKSAEVDMLIEMYRISNTNIMVCKLTNMSNGSVYDINVNYFYSGAAPSVAISNHLNNGTDAVAVSFYVQRLIMRTSNV